MWNAIASPYKAPHVYIIRAFDLVYIGETQKHPTIRWAQHLESGTGLRARLAEKGDPDIDYLNHLKMFSIRCDRILEQFTEAQWKMATQAVEHALHETLAADPRVLGDHLRLISDTEKTAPRSFRRWDLAHTFAKEIIGEVRVALRGLPQYPSLPPTSGLSRT
jgi:hypothetical protein